MSSEELKPCPFCGDDRLFMSVNEAKMHSIFCAGCASEGPSAVEKQDAASAWNSRAQLAAIQGGMGEVVEVVAYGSSKMLAPVRPHERIGSSGEPLPEYDTPLMTVAQHQRITAAMAAEVERHRSANRDLQQMHAADRYEVERLRAELAEVKGREAVGEVVQTDSAGGRYSSNTMRSLPIGTKLYTTPPASPDVEGLCRLLAQAQGMVNGATDQWHDEARDALSTWRQAKT